MAIDPKAAETPVAPATDADGFAREQTAIPDEVAASNGPRLGILDLFGTVDFDPAYDYKAERGRKRLGDWDETPLD